MDRKRSVERASLVGLATSVWMMSSWMKSAVWRQVLPVMLAAKLEAKEVV